MFVHLQMYLPCDRNARSREHWRFRFRVWYSEFLPGSKDDRKARCRDELRRWLTRSALQLPVRREVRVE
jgi:hypothetical protein